MQAENESRQPGSESNTLLSLPVIESCDGCGACCMEQESPPGYLGIMVYGREYARSAEEMERFCSLPDELMSELDEYAKRLRAGKGHPNNHVCLWFDEETRECKRYDLRPDVCREELQVNDEACHRWREAYPPEAR